MWGGTNELIGNNLATSIVAAHAYHLYAYFAKGNRYKGAGPKNETNHNLAIQMGFSLYSENYDDNMGKPNFLPIDVQHTQRTTKDANKRA